MKNTQTIIFWITSHNSQCFDKRHLINVYFLFNRSLWTPKAEKLILISVAWKDFEMQQKHMECISFLIRKWDLCHKVFSKYYNIIKMSSLLLCQEPVAYNIWNIFFLSLFLILKLFHPNIISNNCFCAKSLWVVPFEIFEGKKERNIFQE